MFFRCFFIATANFLGLFADKRMNNGSKQQIKNIANFMAITVFILLYFAVNYFLYIIQDFFPFVKEVQVRKIFI